jgi:hypothetical protein
MGEETVSHWRKSSYSHDNGCIELADLGDDAIGVRDSKLGDDSPVLRFSRPAVAAWLQGSKATEFDDLV